MQWFHFRMSVALVSAWLLTDCARTHQTLSARELLERVHVGMPMAEVNRLLGDPMSPQMRPDGDAWYLPPPRIDVWQSPFAPGTIGVHFSADGTVASKRLNPHYNDK
jgi:hypothetical protein